MLSLQDKNSFDFCVTQHFPGIQEPCTRGVQIQTELFFIKIY